jgi:hypothetical protein
LIVLGFAFATLITWLLFAIVTAFAAGARGRSTLLWFLIGFLLGPFGLVLVLVLPRQMGWTHTRCPACAELVLREATVCRHCHTQITPALVTTPPPAGQLAEHRERARRAELAFGAIAAGIILAALIIANS